nr:cytochrome P450 [Streptomyces sp. SID3343]
MVDYLAAHHDGVSRTVLRNSLRVILHSGYESSSRLLGNALVACLDAPGALARLRGGVTDAALRELVRFAGPVQAEARGCVEDTEVGGQPIRRGEVVTVLVGVANRDPRVFAYPDTLDLDRQHNPHIGFGRGPHACLGSLPALLLTRTVFTALVREHPGMEPVGEPIFRRNATLRGVEHLELRLR